MPRTNFPDGISADGNALVMGTVTVASGAGTVSTGLSTVEGFVATLQEAAGVTAGDPFIVSGSVSAGDIVLAVDQDSGTAATGNVDVGYFAWGTE